MVRGGEEGRNYDPRLDGRDPPGFRNRRDYNSQGFEQDRRYPDEQRRTSPQHAYKFQPTDMEKQTIILEKAAPDQGFGIAVSGGLDNPHYETGDTSVIVSDVVEGSPADGLLRVNDVILNVNNVNVENVEHGVAVEALKQSGYSVKLVILRKRPSTATSSPTSVPSIQEPPSYHRREPSSTSKEPRNVTLTKLPSESYGLSLGTILFVKDLDYRGPAGRDGRLEPGDVILKINSKRVDDLSRPDAVTIMRSAPERLDLVVLKNKDVPPGMPSRMLHGEEPITMTTSHQVESAHNGMNGQELIAFKQGSWHQQHKEQNWDTLRSTTTYSISSAGKRSDSEKDIDVRRDKKFHGEPHLVSFHRTGTSLGIQVAGGNAVGIFAAAIKDGSPAQVAGLRVGDQILSANEIEFRDITREEAVLILLSLPEEVSLLVQFKKSVYDKSKEEPGDSFYVKAHFLYVGSDEDELSFRIGEVFHVLDTMNGGTIGSWRAQRVLQSGAETEVGIIPNKCRAEQLAIAQALEVKKTSYVKLRSATLKRKDTKSTTPKKKQYQAADQLDENSFQVDVKYPAYERVVRRKAGFVRPVVLLGPIADICRDKLMVEYAEKFTTPTTFGRYDAKHQSGIKLSAVRDNIANGKHSLLDVTPDGVEMLNYVGLEPIVIFLQPSSKQLIKDLRHDLTGKTHSARFVKRLYDQAETLSFDFPYLFTAVIALERNNKWYTECVSEIKRQQDDVIWMPEQINQHRDDEVVLQMPRASVGYDIDQSQMDSTTDFDRTENLPHSGDEEVVVAAATVQESESVPAVQAVSVTQRVDGELGPGEIDERELQRRELERRELEQRELEQRELERRDLERRDLERRELERREQEEREFQRRQEEEREYQRRMEEEREFQRRQTEESREQQERDYQRRQQDDYERQLEQREYERKQYEENRVGYDGELQRRDERKPYVPPGIKVLPGSLPPVVSLKKTESGGPRSPRDQLYQEDSRQAIQLRHVERDAEGEKYDERIGVKVSDLFDIEKDIQGGTEEYREGVRREERYDQRRQRSNDEEEVESSRRYEPRSYQPAVENYPESTQDYESRVVVETRTTQNLEEAQRRAEPVEEDLMRSTVKPVEAAEVDLDEMFSSRQVNTNRMQTTMTTTTRTSYQVNNQPRNTVFDTRSGRRVENPVLSNYYPAKARAKIVNVDSERGMGERRRDEPEVKMEYETRVSSEPASYDRRPPYSRYDDEPAPDRRPPPPADDLPPPRPKPYSSMYPRPFGTQSSSSYTEFRRTTPDYPPAEGRQYNDEYQEPVPESATYRYGSTAYRNPTTDYDDPSREATSDFESVGDDEPTVVATARGTFNYRGGTLTSEETGVSIYVPSGAIPAGVEQEIYFKVCKDNSMLPPLDTDKGETLLSPLVMCGPHGTRFLKPVELRLPHSASMTPEGWSFALKSSDTASGQPTQWKNTSLAGRTDQQCKVGSNSVSVLVDHF